MDNTGFYSLCTRFLFVIILVCVICVKVFKHLFVSCSHPRQFVASLRFPLRFRCRGKGSDEMGDAVETASLCAVAVLLCCTRATNRFAYFACLV